MLFWGWAANRRWHYASEGQPAHFVRWYIRFREKPLIETIVDSCMAAYCWVTGAKPPWVREAEEKEESESKETTHDDAVHHGGVEEAAANVADDAESTATFRQRLMLAGFLATYIVWAVFTWIICACACEAPASQN
jgi:hypothetical protein